MICSLDSKPTKLPIKFKSRTLSDKQKVYIPFFFLLIKLAEEMFY